MAMLPSIPEIAKRIDVLKEVDNAIQGGDIVGSIQDSIPKEVGKIYRDNIDGKNYRCIVAGNWITNTTANFEACNVVDNLSKLQNLALKKTEICKNVSIFTNSTLDIYKYENSLEAIYEATYTLTNEGLGASNKYSFNSNLSRYTGIHPNNYQFLTKIGSDKLGYSSNSGENVVTEVYDTKPSGTVMLIVATTRKFKL